MSDPDQPRMIRFGSFEVDKRAGELRALRVSEMVPLFAFNRGDARPATIREKNA
jgi:hypothetical protein